MKAKYFIIYVVVGAAFLTVSLWVLLSKGNNPKAIKAKYKLGGIMLIAWSIIATASCEKAPLPNVEEAIEGGEVMCYDPVPSNYVIFSTENFANPGVYHLHTGGNMTFLVQWPTYKLFSFSINKRVADKNGEEAIGELLQEDTFTTQEESNSYQHTVQYSPLDAEYIGQVVVRVWGKADENQTGELLLWEWNIFITSADED